MEFYIQINPCNPKELKEYLDILEEKGLLDFTDVESYVIREEDLKKGDVYVCA